MGMQPQPLAEACCANRCVPSPLRPLHAVALPSAFPSALPASLPPSPLPPSSPTTAPLPPSRSGGAANGARDNVVNFAQAQFGVQSAIFATPAFARHERARHKMVEPMRVEEVLKKWVQKTGGAGGGKVPEHEAEIAADKLAIAAGDVAKRAPWLKFVSIVNLDVTGPRYLWIRDCRWAPEGKPPPMLIDTCAAYIASTMTMLARLDPADPDYFDFLTADFTTNQVMHAVTHYLQENADGTRCVAAAGRMLTEARFAPRLALAPRFEAHAPPPSRPRRRRTHAVARRSASASA